MLSRWRARRFVPGCAGPLLLAIACGGQGEGEAVRIRVPVGASFSQVTDSLSHHDVIDTPWLFELYARVRRVTSSVQPGTYAFRRDTGWDRILDDLRLGRVETVRIVIPEGWDLRGIAPRIAAASGEAEDSVLDFLIDSATVAHYGMPGPTMEGYLYPATYTFPMETAVDTIVGTMVETYRRVWTPARRARADSIGLSEREVVTLASIVEKEARVASEMSTIAAVYHNRLRINYPLYADPTVQYALGVHRERLLYAAIDSVADNPYNTYRHAGLPPGPIASPSERAIDATLTPAAVNFLYFVARPDGSHIFTRSLEEHNRARAQVARLRQQLGDSAAATGSAGR